MAKNVARTSYFSSASSTSGVTSESGPSSKVSATRLRSRGPCVRVGYARLEPGRAIPSAHSARKAAAGSPRLSADAPNAPNAAAPAAPQASDTRLRRVSMQTAGESPLHLVAPELEEVE